MESYNVFKQATQSTGEKTRTYVKTPVLQQDMMS